MKFVREFRSRRGATSSQSSMRRIEDRVEEEVRRVLQASIVRSRKKNPSRGSRETVEPNAISKHVLLENALILPELKDFCSQFEELQMRHLR